MAKTPDEVIKQLTSPRIENSNDPNATKVQINQKRLQIPSHENYDRNPSARKLIDEYESHMDEFDSGPEMNKLYLDTIFGNDDLTIDDFKIKANKLYNDKYGYDETTDRYWPLYAQYSDNKKFNKQGTLAGLLQNEHSGINLGNVKEYLAKSNEEGPYGILNNPLLWAEKVYDAVDSGEADYSPEEVALAKSILRKWGGV